MALAEAAQATRAEDRVALVLVMVASKTALRPRMPWQTVAAVAVVVPLEPTAVWLEAVALAW